MQIGETPAADAEFGKAGFTVLRPNGSGDYEMYYCYWNRHNDNNDPNLMGPMEFAVVRNNVYKLMVNKINAMAILPRRVLKMIPIRSIRTIRMNEMTSTSK